MAVKPVSLLVRALKQVVDIMHTTVGGIERREEMVRAISTASVILENITPSSSFTVCSRSEQWLLS